MLRSFSLSVLWLNQHTIFPRGVLSD